MEQTWHRETLILLWRHCTQQPMFYNTPVLCCSRGMHLFGDSYFGPSYIFFFFLQQTPHFVSSIFFLFGTHKTTLLLANITRTVARCCSFALYNSRFLLLSIIIIYTYTPICIMYIYIYISIVYYSVSTPQCVCTAQTADDNAAL